ncbi:glycosyltransferase family 2 protein [Crocinitomicaceae bacterium]|nr:glycosyltransferase family 2 protein [Crocinitomicaceae bacterium]
MLITVYITNYNYGAYIKYAVESVLNQSCHDFELLIIDDGSTDNSKEIIEQYREHEKVRIIYQQNKGLNATNNVAMHAAKGKYIMRLDADDYFHESALEELSSKMESDDALGLVFPNYYMVNKDNQIISQEIRHDFDKEVQLFDQAAHGACTMIRTEFLKELGGYNENYTCQDGYELWVKFTRKFKVSNVGTPLFYYRQHGANLTSNENRILDTRAQINADYIKQSDEDTSALIVIPVRGGEKDIAYKSIGDTNFISRKIRQALEASNHVAVVVTSPDENVQKACDEDLKQNKRVLFHMRSQDLARLNESLNGTIQEILALPTIKDLKFESICLITVEYPFLKPHKIDDAIHTMFLFGSDSLISVNADSSLFYVHKGDGLHPILERDQFTKLERETLFRHSGGVFVVRRSVFEKSGKLIDGLVGHMMIDKESSFGVFSQYDYDLAQLIEGANKG